MNYTISTFRNNMGEILDKAKYNKTITSIGRRHKREFVILPVEILEKTDYKTILSILEKQDENNFDEAIKSNSIRSKFSTLASKL